MRYKDLENSIRASVEAFQSKVMVKANKKIEKAIRKGVRDAKSARPAMYIPDRPVRHQLIVLLNVRKWDGHQMGDLIELEFPVNTISELEAEIEAKRQAKAEGYIWRGTVSIEPK